MFFNKVAGLGPIKKETLAQVFSCEFCEILEKLFYRTPPDDGIYVFLVFYVVLADIFV